MSTDTLPPSITNLPRPQLEELIQNPALVKGYIQSTRNFQEYLDHYASIVNNDSTRLLEIKQLVDEYHEVGKAIRNQLDEISKLASEFSDSQVVQYQLLVKYSNEVLIKKYQNMVAEKDKLSKSLIDEDDKELKFLAQFRSARKEYHMVNEKSFRMQEDRVSGMST